MTITHFSRNAILFGIAVLIALSLLFALSLAAPHGFSTFGVSHAAHLVSHGRMLADGPTPPCNPLPGPCQ